MIREINLNVDFEFEAIFFDKSSQMILRTIKRKIEQQKIFEYANAKKKNQ